MRWYWYLASMAVLLGAQVGLLALGYRLFDPHGLVRVGMHVLVLGAGMAAFAAVLWLHDKRATPQRS